MSLQNRVTPAGDIITTSARGTIMGNRGILHDDNKRIVRTTKNVMWLICRLEFNGRKRPLMSPGTYTELFFLDEAVALAAGHRPCGECRRAQYRTYMAAVNDVVDEPLAGPKDLDRRLNELRRAPQTIASIADLPDGAFVAIDDDDYRLLWDGALHRWTPAGYVDPLRIAEAGIESARVLTPAISIAALRHGYSVEVHRSALPNGAAAYRQVNRAQPARGSVEISGTARTILTATEDHKMRTLTPELREEIKRHLRVNPVRHGEVFRAMERGLDVDQMGTSRANAQSFKNSVDAMLTGTLPATKSAAQKNSYGYTYLLGCDVSPELMSYTMSFLRRLAEINPDIKIDKPLQIRALPGTTDRRRTSANSRKNVCPQCQLEHAGECN